MRVLITGAMAWTDAAAIRAELASTVTVEK
jgi:hypothetical protein